MKITTALNQAVLKAAIEICYDYGIDAESPADAFPGTTLDARALSDIQYIILEHLKEAK